MKLKMTAILIISALVLSGCTDSSTAVRVLEQAGYTNVKTTGFKVFGCSEDDFFHTGFTATGQNGEIVNGVGMFRAFERGHN